MARPTKGGMLAGNLKPVERRRLTDLAYEAIRESIVSGSLPMGEQLVELQLSAALSMSRSPIREALQRLATEGLVTERAHQGMFVAEFAAEDVIDLYNVRLGLEITALRLFMKREESTASLRRQIDRMTAAADREDMAGVVRAEFDFHRHIVERASNRVLKRVWDELEGRVTMALALDDSSYEHLHDVASEHLPVVEAIEAGDEMNAVRVFQEHLLSTVGAVIERLDGDRGGLLEPYPETAPKRNRRPASAQRA